MREEIVNALLWEAVPTRFAEAYPDSEIVETYGSGWPPGCLDFWAYVWPTKPCAVLRPEGWNQEEIVVPLSGDGMSDGIVIGREFAHILRVSAP